MSCPIKRTGSRLQFLASVRSRRVVVSCLWRNGRGGQPPLILSKSDARALLAVLGELLNGEASNEPNEGGFTRKVWISSRDQVVRDSHKALDGERRQDVE